MSEVGRIKKILVLGSGGREHAIGWAFKNAGCEVSFYPGNAGTKLVGKNLSINEAELFAGNILADFDLVIPGSEDFLVKG
ncbi:MAG: phosphoribosylamine--glycine ligase, partial [Fervidobacterium pennivorans]